MGRLLRGFIRFYQVAVSPLFPRTCRFYPSCSEYARQAIAEYGWWKGGGMTVRRLLRCHPFHAGGFDPVQPRHEPRGSG